MTVGPGSRLSSRGRKPLTLMRTPDTKEPEAITIVIDHKAVGGSGTSRASPTLCAASTASRRVPVGRPGDGRGAVDHALGERGRRPGERPEGQGDAQPSSGWRGDEPSTASRTTRWPCRSSPAAERGRRYRLRGPVDLRSPGRRTSPPSTPPRDGACSFSHPVARAYLRTSWPMARPT